MMINSNRVLPWLGVLLIAALTAYGGMTGKFLSPLYVLMGGIVFVMLLSRPRLLLMLTVVALASEINLYFLPMQMSLYMVLGGAFCVAAFLVTVWRGKPNLAPGEKTILYWILGFVAVLIVTAIVRGSGLRLLGSDMWGGRPYVLLFFASVVTIHAMYVDLTVRQCKRMLIGYCVAGLFPSLATIAAVYGGVDVFTPFVAQADDVAKAMSGMTGDVDPAFRLQIANVGATYLFLLMWLVQYSNGLQGRFLMWCCGLAGVVLTGLSGHRIALLFGVVLSVAYILLDTKGSVFGRLVNRYSILLVVMLSLLIMISPQLPMTFQRSLAWLPFVDVAGDTRIDTDVTSQWRIEVWKRALEEVPQHLIVGKGFAFSSGEMLSYVRWTMNDFSFVITSHNYHNGVIHILMDLGLSGILVVTGFIVAVFLRHYRLLSKTWNSTVMRHFHRVMLAGFVAQVIVFLVVGGGILTLVTLLFVSLILGQIVKADRSAGGDPAVTLA